MSGDILLVAALGNIGNQYETTRHNIAWQLIEYLPFYNELNWQEKFNGLYATYTIDGEKVYFIKPQTFMNLSGRSVGPLMQFFKIDPARLLVIHDELELDFGVMGFKSGGGLAGHNGLRSVAQVLGTQDFQRMRMGIGRPAHPDITSYVLGNFSPDERIELPTYLEKSAGILAECLAAASFGNMLKKHRKTRLLQEF